MFDFLGKFAVAVVKGCRQQVDRCVREAFGDDAQSIYRWRGADIRNIFNKLGGAMAEPGAVGWQFSRRGVVMVDGAAAEDDVLMVALDAGADDVSADDNVWRVLCEPSAVFEVKAALEAAGMTVTSAESTMVPSTTIAITEPDEARKVLRIMDALEDNDDVQDVYANFDIAESIMAGMEA